MSLSFLCDYKYEFHKTNIEGLYINLSTVSIIIFIKMFCLLHTRRIIFKIVFYEMSFSNGTLSSSSFSKNSLAKLIEIK